MTPCRTTGYPGYSKTTYKGQSVYWHRLTYVLAHNLSLHDIEGKVVMHTCDNAACVNPEHLVLGTQKDNMQDCIVKGRRGKTGPAKKLTVEQEQTIIKDFRTDQQIACDYGVSPKTINRIKARYMK